MSASHYRRLLHDELTRSQNAAQSAKEWKIVAENRLKLLVSVDHLLTSKIVQCMQVESIFSVAAEPPDLPEADILNHSGQQVYGMILSKMTSLSHFTAALAREAVGVQSALDEVLSLAIQAISPSPPVADLDVEVTLQDVEDASSPLQGFVDEIEDLPLIEEPTPDEETHKKKKKRHHMESNSGHTDDSHLTGGSKYPKTTGGDVVVHRASRSTALDGF